MAPIIQRENHNDEFAKPVDQGSTDNKDHLKLERALKLMFLAQ